MLLGLGGVAAAQERAPDLTLRGGLTRADHETYIETPFQVPAGVTRITIEVSYTGREERTVIDLGLRDPERFRGWSGGNKSRFTVSAEEATPSYLPGPIIPGTWRLVLGVPNIRETSKATYEGRVWFARRGDVFAGFAAPLRPGAGWYRGDLHMHTGHSDGSCQPQSRRGETTLETRVPCPAFRTVEAAAARGLDFIAITDHNATSHAQALRELQTAFDRLLLIPGREITTFQGHANMFGPTSFVDFQIGEHVPTMNAVIDQVRGLGGVFSVNHPSAPSGELCMGCGWTVSDTDWTRVTAIEAVNGGSILSIGDPVTPLAAVAFWERLLDRGHRLTAIGGSDNHDPDRPLSVPGAIGRPTTVVWAEALSQPAVLEAIRSGRVFIDLDGDPKRAMEFTGVAQGAQAQMGGTLKAADTARFTVQTRGIAGGKIEVIQSGRAPEIVDGPPLTGEDETRVFDRPVGRAPGWVRVNLRDASGRLILVGNPIYLNH